MKKRWDYRLALGIVVEIQDLGKRLKQARLRRRWGFNELAQRASISLATLGRIERGEVGIGIAPYMAVLWALGLGDGLRRLALDTQMRLDVSEPSVKIPKRICKSKTIK